MSKPDYNGVRKRKRCERTFRFKTFGLQGHPVEYNGTFRENVIALLEFGHLESRLSRGMPSWSFQLEVRRHPSHQVLLFIIEEPIAASLSRHCKHCKYIGWGHHMICNKKYHFVLPSKDTIANCLFQQCNNDEAKIKSTLIDMKGHLLHGVIHSNGFGHLLSINGVEVAGSELSGHRIMEFWNQLCTSLQVRKVSMNDISVKKGIELRLLHGIAYGRSWFGQWGYKFGRGSFGVSQTVYEKAIEALQNIPLSLIYNQVGTFNHDIPIIFSRYVTLSDNSLVTLRDIFHFMLELRSHLPQENLIDSCNPSILVETACRWSVKRVEMATQVIVGALKMAKYRWVSRQEVRDAARSYIGDTGLLDFVLKSLGNHIVGNYFVRRSLNPVTKVLEYCLEDISNVLHNQATPMSNSSTLTRYKITRAQLMKDVMQLYYYILKDHSIVAQSGILSVIPVASQIVLDSKYLIKDFETEPCPHAMLGQEDNLKLYCTILLKDNKTREEEEGEGEEKTALLPYERITLKSNATFNELKQEVEKCFKELYWGLKSFVADSIINLDTNTNNDQVLRLVDVGYKLALKGSNMDEFTISDDMYENGLSDCIVDCCCDTKDEDGERMISCDICEVWQHTRCVQIPDNEEIPHVFLCKRCEHNIILSPSLL